MGNSLWHPYKIPIVVLAGEVGSGKTLWGLTVDESTLSFDKPASTLIWDTEGSSDPYVGTLNFDRVDLVKLCVKKHGPDYTPQRMFEVWKESMISVPAGKYTVGIIDTIPEIEAGHGDYVRGHPGAYGYTAAQFAKAAGLMWGAVKADEKRLLMSLASKVQTLVITLHMRDEFKGGKSTHKRIPKGKDTLMDIASLYMIIDRSGKPGSKEAPTVPCGICDPPQGKSRIVGLVDGKLRPLLPPFLNDASPNGIRAYLANPPDFSNLKLGERAKPIPVMTEDDRLELRARIAADEAARASADLATQELKNEIDKEVAPTSPTKTPNRPISNEEILAVRKPLLEAMSLSEAKILLKAKFNVSTIAELTRDQLHELQAHILTISKK